MDNLTAAVKREQYGANELKLSLEKAVRTKN